MSFEMTRKKIITIVAVVVILAAALYIIYDLNGKSLDVSNREVRIVVTNSMDGDVHPSYWYECSSGDKTHQFTNMDGATDCIYCHSAVTRHSTDIGKVPVNDLVMIHKLDSSEKQNIHAGDVISFDWNNRLTIHRVIEVKCDSSGQITGFVTKGDNVTGMESPSIEKVQGVVVGESEMLGSFVHFAQGSTILLVMIIVILIVIVSVVRDIVRMRRNDRA